MYLSIIGGTFTGQGPKSGVYFAENGTVEWTKLAKLFAAGLNIPGDVVIADNAMIIEMVEVLGLATKAGCGRGLGAGQSTYAFA